MFSRRDPAKAAPGSVPEAGKIDSVVCGVQFGLQSYIFTGLGLPQETLVDTVIQSMVESGLGECDLYAPLVEPAAREDLAVWRKSASMDQFCAVRKKFEDAGISIHATSGFPASTEEELRYTFDVASALGARLITLQIGMEAARRIVPVAEKSGFVIGIQGDPDMHPADRDAISRPEQYDRALTFSGQYQLSFDIGDAVGKGYDDVVGFVESHLDRIALIYLKDRRRDNRSVP